MSSPPWTTVAWGSGRCASRSTPLPREVGWCSTCSGRWPSSSGRSSGTGRWPGWRRPGRAAGRAAGALSRHVLRHRPRRRVLLYAHTHPDDAATEVTPPGTRSPVSYTHLRAHETRHDLVCRLLLEKKKTNKKKTTKQHNNKNKKKNKQNQTKTQQHQQ